MEGMKCNVATDLRICWDNDSSLRIDDQVEFNLLVY